MIAGAIGAAPRCREMARGGAVIDGERPAKGAVIGGLISGRKRRGRSYGLNENKKHDERYRNAYASCMHARLHGVNRLALVRRTPSRRLGEERKWGGITS